MAPPRRSPRAVLISVLLVLALGLAGLLAFNAQATFREHRATAERVLRDYARLAAARFAQRTAQNLYYMACWPVVEAFTRSGAGTRPDHLPTPAALAAGLDSVPAAFVRHARYAFRLNLRSGQLVTAGAAPSAAVRRWLKDTLPLHLEAVYMKEEHVAALVDSVDGASRLVVYTLAKPASPGAAATLLGIEVDPRAMAPFYTMSSEKFPLLPRPLTGGVIYDSLGSLEVTEPSGRELYHSPVRYHPMFTARDSVEPMMAGLHVQVTLRPDIADKLVIGGLPRSRLPFVLGVLLLTAGLIVTALVQLRREYDLARLRTDFVSGVSHELRTPLAQIRMFGETLLLGRVRSDAERRRSLEIIDQEARRLTHLVENLLHFSRSERQAHRVAPEPTWMAPLIRSVVEAFAPLAVPRRVRLRADIADGVVAAVDPEAFRQMLLNLLDNAVKYGPEDQSVTVTLAPPDAAGRVRVTVDDQGPGIPPAERERIWERFWRLERDRGSAVAGTGIGLAVVRELAALHRGRAWIEDPPAGHGGGARFVLEVPAAAPPAAPPAADRSAPAEATA